MYRKAKFFGANEIADKILRASTPKACKDLGRSREIPFVESVWVKHREDIYREVLLDKFSVPELKQELLRTGRKELAEASPYDKIWGIRLRETDKRAEDPKQWRGTNLLGVILKDVRSELAGDHIRPM